MSHRAAPMSDRAAPMRERATLMHQRVIDRYAREAVGRGEIDRVSRSLMLALSHRDALLADDHHIDLLHPARTLLILMDDAGVMDAVVLALAALVESEKPEMAGTAAQPTSHRTAVVPTRFTTGRDSLLEELLALEPALVDVALAERLDHARHLHLRPRADWGPGFALEEAVYLPLAERRGGLVGRRYARWERAFRARMRA